jgi:WD40 repeat protein
MIITKILQKRNINKYNLGKTESGLSTENKADVLEGSVKIIGKTLEFRQSMYDESFIAIPYSKKELVNYLNSANVNTEQQTILVSLFDETIETAKVGEIVDKNELISTYFEFLDELPTLSENAIKRIKYSMEQTVGTILIENVESKNNLI